MLNPGAQGEGIMKKSLSYRLFRIGAIPAKFRPVLEAEGILVADEGMAGRMISRHVRAPGKRCFHRQEGFSGWLAVTRKRVVCYTYGKRQINVAADDAGIAKLRVDVPGEGILSLSFDTADFRRGWSGGIEFRFRTEKARQFHEVLTSMGVGRNEADHR